MVFLHQNGSKISNKEKIQCWKITKKFRLNFFQMVSLEFPKLKNACHCNFGLLKIGLKFQKGEKSVFKNHRKSSKKIQIEFFF